MFLSIDLKITNGKKTPKVGDDKLNTLNKKYKQCMRMWRYSINEDKL